MPAVGDFFKSISWKNKHLAEGNKYLALTEITKEISSTCNSDLKGDSWKCLCRKTLDMDSGGKDRADFNKTVIVFLPVMSNCVGRSAERFGHCASSVVETVVLHCSHRAL